MVSANWPLSDKIGFLVFLNKGTIYHRYCTVARILKKRLVICYIIEVEKKIIIENQQLYTVCYQYAKDLWTSVIFFY